MEIPECLWPTKAFCDLRIESLNLYLFKLVGLVKTGLALNLQLDLVRYDSLTEKEKKQIRIWFKIGSRAWRFDVYHQYNRKYFVLYIYQYTFLWINQIHLDADNLKG